MRARVMARTLTRRVEGIVLLCRIKAERVTLLVCAGAVCASGLLSKETLKDRTAAKPIMKLYDS